jgi:hypothetical protein
MLVTCAYHNKKAAPKLAAAAAGCLGSTSRGTAKFRQHRTTHKQPDQSATTSRELLYDAFRGTPRWRRQLACGGMACIDHAGLQGSGSLNFN